MILGSNAIIMNYSDARFLADALYRLQVSGGLKKAEEKSFLKLQEAVQEIESNKFGDADI
jgi:hypothetical protein